MKMIKLAALVVLTCGLSINAMFRIKSSKELKLGRTLCEAAKFGDMETLKQYKDVLATQDVRNANGDTPLLAACYGGQIKAYIFLKACKKKWSDSELRGDFGAKCLHYAAQGNKLAMVKHLVEVERCDINMQNGVGSTALHIASYCRYFDIVTYLLKKNAKDTKNMKGDKPSDFLKIYGYGDWNVLSPRVHSK